MAMDHNVVCNHTQSHSQQRAGFKPDPLNLGCFLTFDVVGSSTTSLERGLFKFFLDFLSYPTLLELPVFLNQLCSPFKNFH